jgi:hypothetical protein
LAFFTASSNSPPSDSILPGSHALAPQLRVPISLIDHGSLRGGRQPVGLFAVAFQRLKIGATPADGLL